MPDSPLPERHEVELKFLAAPGDLDAVLAAAPAGPDDSHELISVYFDTPDRALEKAGASLRVRESRGRRVQTLKRGVGLRREEHEQPIEGFRPQGDLGPLRALLPAGPDALRPAFNVRVTRRQRTFRFQDAEIELAVDTGEVADGPRTRPICEVELELKAGPPAALFALARDLVQAVPLYLSFESKADRGRALAAGAPPVPKARPAALPRKATVAEAFQAAARPALAQVAATAARLREADGSEAVHQLRVALRRLRSGISTFKPLIGDDPAAARLKGELRWLAKTTDAARELDVLGRLLLDPDQARAPPARDLEAEIDLARRAAHRKVRDAVSDVRFRVLMVDAVAWVEGGDWLMGPSALQPARAFARRALDRRLRKVLKRGKGLDRASDAQRHELRIAAKTLRYAADGFSGLFKPRQVRAVSDPLKRLQDSLGVLNDAAVAEPLIARLDLAPEAAFEAGKRLGRLARDRPARLAEARRCLKALAAVEPYWR